MAAGTDPADEMEREWERERAIFRKTADRQTVLHDTFIRTPIPKPFLYLERMDCTSVKDKLTARTSMSYREYVVGYLKMMLVERVARPADWRVLADHLLQVSQDTGTRPWEDVSQWSQAMFDQIETGDISWDNHMVIQINRVRPPITKSMDKPAAKTAAKTDSLTPCAVYNKGACRHNGRHK